MTIEFQAPSAVALEAARVVRALGDRAVRGRVENVFHGNVHSFFRLVDESDGALRCRIRVHREIRNGDTVRVVGSLFVFVAKGDLQLDVSEITIEEP